MNLILIGAGQRGMIYAKEFARKGHRIVAAADLKPERRELARREFGIPSEMLFESAENLLSLEPLGTAAIIASMDRFHYGHAIAALKKGYHLLLEKPISPVPEETLEIERTALEMKREVVVCHVLRYSPYFREIKRVIDSGVIGRVLTVQHNENIGNYHIAHSFVRGNWRREDQASSLMMQKSCHDMDLLTWLIGSPCRRVASFGERVYFRAENAPEGSAERCCDCRLKDSCRFSAYLAYLPVRGDWPATVLTTDQSEEGLKEAIRTGPYGRCVYHCDNDVCDQQVTILEFENGVTATFNLSGFTNRMARTLKIMGENGEIRASEYENVIEVNPFAPNAVDRMSSTVIHPEQVSGGHGGGDTGIVEDFLALMQGHSMSAASEITKSVESHMMVGAAEQSRKTGNVVTIRDFREAHGRGTDL